MPENFNGDAPPPDPAAELARARADIERQRQYAGPLLRPVWDVLARLARVLAFVLRQRG